MKLKLLLGIILVSMSVSMTSCLATRHYHHPPHKEIPPGHKPKPPKPPKHKKPKKHKHHHPIADYHFHPHPLVSA